MQSENFDVCDSSDGLVHGGGRTAITEYQKQPAPAGWSVQCIPGASPYADDLGDDEPSAAEPAQ
jgi:hypothetical protein